MLWILRRAQMLQLLNRNRTGALVLQECRHGCQVYQIHIQPRHGGHILIPDLLCEYVDPGDVAFVKLLPLLFADDLGHVDEGYGVAGV